MSLRAALQEARNLRRSLQEFIRETNHYDSTCHIKEQLLKEDYLDEEYVRKMDDPYREDELINLNDISETIEALIEQIDQKLAAINFDLKCIKCQDLPEYQQLMDKLNQMMKTVRDRKAAFTNLFYQTVQTLTDAQKAFDNDDLYEQGKIDWQYRNRLRMEHSSGKRLGKKK